MKKIKILVFVLLIIIVLNITLPSLSLAAEEIKNEEKNENTVEITDKKNIEEDTNIEKENLKEKTEVIENTIEKNKTEAIENTTEKNKTEDADGIVENVENLDEKIIDSNKDLDNDLDKKIEEQEQMNKLEETEKNENEEFSIYVIDNNDNKINSYEKNGSNYIFVPKGINISDMIINYTGNIETIDNAELNKQTKQITGEFQNESSFTITLSDGQIKNIIIIQSDVPAIFLKLNSNVTIDTVNSGNKDVKYLGSVNVTGCENNINNISQNEIEFKGRGNTSWAMPKKSYQIKLNEKTNFLGIGDSKEKKWVLIANYQDPTLVKNKIINDLCVKTGLAKCPNSSYADLYINGTYVGNYLVCDKIEIKKNRVNLSNEKGVLVELDNAYYKDENYYFQSKRGKFYTIKEAVSDGNDTLTRQAMNSFKNALDSFEDELYSSNPSWNRISKMIDVESFAKYYLINEFAKNPDEYYSSCFLYKDGENDVIHMGPTWDYDAAFGSGYRATGKDTNVDFTLTFWQNNMQYLYLFPEFAKTVNEIYTKNMKPVLDNLDVNQISNSFKQSSKINTIVWSNYNKYYNLKNELNSFVNNRKEYFKKRYSNKQLEYSTHIENKGWMTSKRNGISGTEGQSLRIEGLKIEIGSGYGENISISYKSHVQNIGWQNWVSNGNLSGTTGQGLQLEAVQIKLNNAVQYSVRYRVHIQDIGWQDWKYDGQVAGTEGQSKRIEAIEIELVEKESDYIKENTLINYKAHVQNIGDTEYGSDGEVVGTTGRGLRLEGLNIKLNETLLPSISLIVDTHIQDIGWQTGFTDKQFIGTSSKSLRMEAIKIRIAGDNTEKYSIKYRVHVQDIGWQDWKENGEMAGTEGQAKRIEAIQIQIVEK